MAFTNRTDPTDTLVCFAVPREAKFFVPRGSAVLITGMGRTNAARAVSSALQHKRPALVLSCGFAGGLHPAWTCGTPVFSADAEAGLDALLQEAGARPAR